MSNLVWSKSPWSADELPSINVKPPYGEEAKETIKNVVKYEGQASNAPKLSQAEWPVIWKNGHGCFITDPDNNKYLDFTSGFVVTNAGHCHPKIVKAVQEQLNNLIYCKSHAPHPTRAKVLKKLAEVVPINNSKILFAIGGAEANHIALKASRCFTGKPNIIAYQGSFHGKTGETLHLTSNRTYRSNMLLGNSSNAVTHVPYPYCYRCVFKNEYPKCDFLCVDYIKNILENPSSGLVNVGAIIAEPILGAEGCVVPPPGYFKRVQKLCQEHGLLLIIDEIQTGFARSGAMFACEHQDITPDILVVGKGISSGVPMAAVAARAEIFDSMPEASQTSTFAGNPLGWAAALSAMEVYVEDQLVEYCKQIGQYTLNALRSMQNEFECIGDVRGAGMLIGIEFVYDKTQKKPNPELTKLIREKLTENGIYIDVIGGYKNVIAVRPPLPISQKQMDYFLETLYKILKNK